MTVACLDIQVIAVFQVTAEREPQVIAEIPVFLVILGFLGIQVSQVILATADYRGSLVTADCQAILAFPETVVFPVTAVKAHPDIADIQVTVACQATQVIADYQDTPASAETLVFQDIAEKVHPDILGTLVLSLIHI